VSDRPIYSTVFVDVDTGAQTPDWAEHAVDPPHDEVEVIFERRAEDGQYYGPGLSRIVVKRDTGKLVSFDEYPADAAEVAKRSYVDRLEKIEPGMVLENRRTGARHRVVDIDPISGRTWVEAV
jgi:hypothetical protein